MRDARRLFPATESLVYLNTAAVGLASRSAAAALHGFVDDWVESGMDYVTGEAAAETCRTRFASMIGAERGDIALISSVSAAAGLVASQFGPSGTGENIVIGEREYSSNHFPWRMLAKKGYDVRQVPFRDGGLDAGDVAQRIDSRTRLVAFSAVQTASGFRADIPAISAAARAVEALVFVDGTQLIGAMPVAGDLAAVDVLAAPDHKFLLNAGRGMGYCYLSPEVQERFTPTSAGWKAGRIPFESFFGPGMDLSPTASRFDQSISWVAAVGGTAAFEVFDVFGVDEIYRRNDELATLLRAAMTDIGWDPVDLPAARRSRIVSIPIRDAEPAQVVAALRQRNIVCAARDGHLRLAVHFYNHEDDIAAVQAALSEL